MTETALPRRRRLRHALALPNLLTYGRLAAVPVVAVLLQSPAEHWMRWTALAVFTVAGVTDFLDGYLARIWKQQSPLGQMLDPIADKLLISAAFISLVEMGLVQGWMVVVIIGREFIVMGLRNIATAEGLIIPATPLGKTKMVLQVICGCAVILAAKHPSLTVLGKVLLWAVVLSAIVSAVHYFQMFWSQVNHRVQERRKSMLILEQQKKPQNVPTR